MASELVPKNGKHLPYGFPDSIKQRAIMFCMESQSVALGHRRLKHELERWGLEIPDYHSVWNWARESEECYQAVTGPKKREMIAISSDAALMAAERLIQAIPNLSDGQAAVPYGIAMQRRTDWDKTDQAGVTTAIQINITSGGKKLED